MTGLPQPRMHGSTHVCGGSDPIPGICDLVSPVGGGRLADAILDHPSVTHFWPMNDVGPGAADMAGSEDLAENPAGSTSGQPVSNQGVYAFTYEQSGPFLDDPAATAIVFDGDAGGATPLGTCLYYNPVTLVTSGAWSMLGWAYNDFSYPGRSAGAVFSLYGGSSPTVQLYINAGDYVFLTVTGSGSYTVTDTAAATTPGWHFWAVTTDPTAHEISLYLDGALVGTTTYAGTALSSGYLRFGCQGTGVSAPSNFWKGKLCQVGAFSTVLTADEITGFYALTGAPHDPGTVPVADGSGGYTWEFPTIEVTPPDGRYDTIILGTGLTGTDNTDGSITVDASGFDPATATEWWFPLVDSDGTCVLDGDGALIPTLIPL